MKAAATSKESTSAGQAGLPSTWPRILCITLFVRNPIIIIVKTSVDSVCLGVMSFPFRRLVSACFNGWSNDLNKRHAANHRKCNEPKPIKTCHYLWQAYIEINSHYTGNETNND
jgi:hypothetical protein